MNSLRSALALASALCLAPLCPAQTPAQTTAQTQVPAATPGTIPPATATADPKGFEKVLNLWPAAAPLSLGTGEGDTPRLYTYPAPGAGTHPAVIVMPGGGYNHLVMEQEGAEEARWLSAHGISAFVLVYRLSPRYRWPAADLDGARAIRYVRANASTLGIDPARVGIWGFSAGGHLAGMLATVHDSGTAGSADPVEQKSSRPDFVILSYARVSMDTTIPRNGSMESILGDHPTQAAIDSIDAVKHVTADTSPTIIYSTTGDQTVNSLNATAFYDALKRAGVRVELHIFERGPHGTHMGLNLKPELSQLTVWPTLLENWLTQNGWMDRK